MLITFAALSLMAAQPITSYTRPEPPRTREQQEEDAQNEVSEGERSASKRSSTAVETLLTFCPPGPEERENCSVSSQSWIVT